MYRKYNLASSIKLMMKTVSDVMNSVEYSSWYEIIIKIFFHLNEWDDVSILMINFVRSRYAAVVRALTSCQCSLGWIPAQCHMWVEFVAAQRVFLYVLWFSSLRKKTI